MFKTESIEVKTTGGFVFKNRSPVEVAKLVDKIKALNPQVGFSEFTELVTMEGFADSLVDWSVKEELNRENAIEFYKSFKSFAQSQLQEAKKLIEIETNEQLKNLLTGRNGDVAQVE